MNDTAVIRRDNIRSKIIEIICDLSGLDGDDINDNETFLELGFDSLFMTQIAGEFQNCFSIEVTFRQLMRELNTIENLAAFLVEHLPADRFAEQPSATPDDGLPGADESGDETNLQTRIADPGLAPALEFPKLSGANLGDSDRLRSLMLEQLRLMSHQLSLLQGGAGIGSEAQPVAVAAKSPPEPTREKPGSENKETREIIKLPPGFGPQIDSDLAGKSLGDRQVHVDNLIQEYVKRTGKSKELTQDYRQVHADPRTAAGFNPMWKEMVYPIVIERSKGAHLWDVDGNEYIDLLNGFGPNFLGHAPDYIQEALHEQIDRGFELGPQTPYAGEVAKLVCELTGTDRATFVNTGSEAVQAAIRVSRTVTGKDKIVVFKNDYHGNFDEVLVRGANSGDKLRTLPLAPGIPRSAVQNILVLEYGADRSLDIIRENQDEIAAVLIEPVQSRYPDFRPVEFVQKLRELTEANNIVFVFDEVITGFRTGLGGAQEYYGVKADLVTYGKVLGGGMPIGVVAGKERYMNTFDGGMWQYGDDSFPEAGVTFFAGTFLRHPLAIVAARAALNFLKTNGPDLYKGVYEKTARLALSLNTLFQNNDVGICVAYFSSQMYFRITDDNELIELLFYHARLRGLYMLEGFPSYLTLCHTDEDIDVVIQIFSDSIAAMQAGGIIPLPAGRSTEPFPLTAAQFDIWVAAQLSETASCAYNESDTVKLKGPLDVPALESAIKLVLSRHQGPNITIESDGTMQSVDWSMPHQIDILDLSKLADAKAGDKLELFYENCATTRFDLENGPLVKLHLVKLADELHLLVIYGHHIVFDGWSSSILLHEIGETYSAFIRRDDLSLPPSMSFSRYTEEVKTATDSTQYNDDIDYWKSCYSDRVPQHNLPLDFKRGKQRSFEGATLHYEFDRSVLEAVRRSAKEAGVTVHSFLLAGFSILLQRKSGDSEFVIGIPTAGQMNASNDCLVGYCVYLLPMRQPVDGQQEVNSLLTDVRDNVLEAFCHSLCSYSDLLKMLPVCRDAGRLPLVEIVFNYSSYFDELGYEGLQTAVYENPRKAVVFDMFLNIVEMEGKLQVDWDYSSELFAINTIEHWVEELGSIYKLMAEGDDLFVHQLVSGIVEDQRAAN